MDVQQLLLLAVALAVPLVLFTIGKPRLVLGWVGITLSVHIFDTTIFTNLPAARVVGLLYLPYALLTAPSWFRTAPAQIAVISLIYLMVLGVIFGFVIPWPDTTGHRPFNMTAPGRAVVYLTRLLVDLSLTVFVAHELRKPGAIFFLARTFVLGATLSALAGLLLLVIPGFDPYFAITGLRNLNGIQFVRARGLSFEPRGLGMACVYSLMILIIKPVRLTFQRQWLMLINVLGMLVSYSSSSLALFAAGIITAATLLSRGMRRTIMKIVLVASAFTLIGALTLPQQFAIAKQTVIEHLDPTIRLRGAEPENLGQAIAYRLDSFDASALLFLFDQPLYIFIGTGPGMMLLPASNYVPPGLFSAMYPPERGLDGLPTHGPLLELSNGGVITLAAWIVQIILCWRALRIVWRRQTDPQRAQEWQFGRGLFLIGVVFYTIQTSITSPIWAVLLGIGWAAALLTNRQAQLSGSSARKEVALRTEPLPSSMSGAHS
ncbi:MAG: hypothetical protein M3R24_36655 [Chloroflexota bacterium]|nr:hypothetical protein [Chloroflexota bacterium]